MGRRPKADAIRRAHQSQAVIRGHSLPMPDLIAENALMRECWEWTANATHFSEEHIPQLIALTYWWAVARQCMANLNTLSGGVTTKVDTPMGPRQDPDVRTMQTATTQIRQLSAELGIGPLAQKRMGLMQVATASMAADLSQKVFRMLDEHYGD